MLSIHSNLNNIFVKIQAELEHRFDVTAGLSTIHRMLRQL